ncbi:5-bromo-4-chloroindolyl phosphate hydrolysis family protein [Albirhodobacter sp. R86504]|jgi:hypothetical protein|uniref:5-bromo-4-chloroindolyl phosphate hydrolysis family protein n=1 Tax=Albirhodobacter sp. R86504 TaxID=3093848 RepID=UPI00366E524F
MAQRFGGRFSPKAAPQETSRNTSGDRQAYPVSDRVTRGGATPTPKHPLDGRPVWIVGFASPLLLLGIGDGGVTLVRSLGGFALIWAAMMLVREGLRAQTAFDARRVARRPALPRKILGSLAFGAGLALAAAEATLLNALTSGAVGTVLSLVAFGIDPLRDKGMEGIDTFQQDRVARVVAEGEKHLAAMKDAILRTRDRQLEARVDRFCAHARDLFRVVEEDPADLAQARRYMGVYLEGARDATIKFADLWAQTADPSARQEYETLLDDLERNFSARTKALIADGRGELEIEIDVLRDRLAREGLAPAANPTPDA